MLDPFVILSPLLLLPVVWLLRFIGCTPFSGTDIVAPVVKISPHAASLKPGVNQQFTVLVDGSPSVKVTWSSNAPNGLFTAPVAFVPGGSAVTVKATSTHDASASDSATVTLTPNTVTVTPPSAILKPGESQQFAAFEDASSSKYVTWSPNAPNGLFTAPVPYVLDSPPVTVTAASQVDPSVQGAATVTLIGNGAKFVKLDTVTQGTWNGVYGSAGWALANSPNIVKPPAYFPGLNAALAPWAVTPVDPTSDPRGLLVPPAFASRFAAAWYDPPDLQLDFTQTHQVAIYCVDWDTIPTRFQTVEIVDKSQMPEAVLYSKDLSAFGGGQYLVLELRGTVNLRVLLTPGQKNDPGQTAVINAIFFD